MKVEYEYGYAVFLLELVWNWDNHNTVYVTIPIESYLRTPQSNLDCFLEHLDNPTALGEYWTEKIMNLHLRPILENHDESPNRNGRMIRLYKVKSLSNSYLFDKNKIPAKLEMELIAICDFEDNKPISIK